MNMSSVNPEKPNLDKCSSWCITDGDKIESGVEKKNTTFVWRVKNFSARPEKKGQFIQSDSFSVISPNGVATKWKLYLYPKGDKYAKDEKFSVYLEILDTKARASYKILISNKNGKKMETLVHSDGKERIFKKRGTETGGWGVRNALSIDQLKEKWLFDDVLTLVCEMSVLETNYDIEQNHQLQMMKDLGKAFKRKNSMDVTMKC